MEQNILKVAHHYIQKYQENIKSQYPNVDLKVLQKLWNEGNLKNIPETNTKTNSKKKKTAYQNFFVIARERLTKNNPTLKFGEISKLVSKEWSSLTHEKKKEYENNTENITSTLQAPEKDKKCNNNFIDFFDKPSSHKDDFRFEFENDPEDDLIIEEDLDDEEVDEEDEVYFDDENTFEMDD